MLNGKRIRHEHQPVYLGVTLDRSLTFRSHMVKTAAKVRTRKNLITKLAIFFNISNYLAPLQRLQVFCGQWLERLVEND